MVGNFANKGILKKISGVDGALVNSTNPTEVGAFVDCGDIVGDICAVVAHGALVKTKTLTVEVDAADNASGTGAVKVAELVYTEAADTPAAGIVEVPAILNPNYRYYSVKVTTNTTTAIAVTAVIAGQARYAE